MGCKVNLKNAKKIQRNSNGKYEDKISRHYFHLVIVFRKIVATICKNSVHMHFINMFNEVTISKFKFYCGETGFTQVTQS